jgi:hypothetical protein
MSLAGTSRHFAAMQNLVIADIEQADPMNSRLARCKVARSRIISAEAYFSLVRLDRLAQVLHCLIEFPRSVEGGTEATV